MGPNGKRKPVGGLGYGLGLLVGVGSVVIAGLLIGALTSAGLSNNVATVLVAGAMVLGLAGWAIAVPRHRPIVGGVVLGIVMTYVLIAAVAAIALVILAGMCMAGLQ